MSISFFPESIVILYVLVIGDYAYISLYISSMSTSVSSMCIYNVLLSFYLFWYIINTYCQRNNESEYETTIRSFKKVGQVFF